MSAGVWMRWRSRVRIRTRVRQWWRRRDPRRAGLPRVFANSLPKSGTHLLIHCVTLLPGMIWEELGLRGAWLVPELGEAKPEAGGEVVPVGVTRQRYVEAKKLAKVIRRLQPGEVTGGHMPYSAVFAAMLERAGIRSLLVLRDPRDVAVSLVYYILGQRGTRMQEYFARTLKTDDERLLVCIRGASNAPGGAPHRFPPIAERLGLFLPWLQAPLNYTTRFERLVGSRGGGSREEQRTEIENIARHLGFSLSSEQVDSVARNLFWEGSPTFRRGQIGSWREHFKDEHKAAFKEVAGQYLIDLGYEKELDW